MKIEEARTQPLRFAVDDVENLHLFSFGQPEETHEREFDVDIVQVAEAVSAIDLSQRLARARRKFQDRIRTRTLPEPPRLIGARSGIECQRDGGASFKLNIFSKIE